MSCRYDKTQEVYHESNALDAKRYDILYGIDPLSATIFDRSINRTFPIVSWSIEISTNNFRVSWFPTMTYTVTAAPDYWRNQDKQNFFAPLTGRLWRYGDYCISMIVTAGAEDLFTKSTQNSSVTTTIFDALNPCIYYLYEGIVTFTRDVSVSIYANLTTYGEWLSSDYDCFPPNVSTITALAICPFGYTGNMIISAPVSTTYFSFYSVTGTWSVQDSASCIIPIPDPETNPQPIGPVLMNNYTGKQISYQSLDYPSYWIDVDYNNKPTALNASAAWNSYSRYTDITASGLPYGYDYLNGVRIEAIYLHKSSTEIGYLPSGYTHPCTGSAGSHTCDRAYFEVWGCNSTADQTITLYLCSAKDLYWTYNHNIVAPHSSVTWIRVTKDNTLLYNGCPVSRITTIPWATTPPP